MEPLSQSWTAEGRKKSISAWFKPLLFGVLIKTGGWYLYWYSGQSQSGNQRLASCTDTCPHLSSCCPQLGRAKGPILSLWGWSSLKTSAQAAQTRLPGCRWWGTHLKDSKVMMFLLRLNHKCPVVFMSAQQKIIKLEQGFLSKELTLQRDTTSHKTGCVYACEVTGETR